jgi:DNA-binding transcriptional MerR regulator
MAATLTVGEFSRMTHLSVKTLRHYHQVGLLEPAEVNPHTGYRYYTTAQIPAVQVIRRLRDLEMPVPEVKAVLAAPDTEQRNALIAAHLDRLEAQLAQTRAAVDSLRNLLRPPDDDGAPIVHRTVARAAAAGIRQTVDRAGLEPWWRGALAELKAVVEAQGLRATGPAGGLFASGVYQDEQGEATLFVPVAGPVRPIGRVAPVTIPGAELAVITHRGGLGDIDLSYGRLGAHVATSAIGVDGPLREYYLTGAHDTPDQTRWRTEIAWPIFRADTPAP